jgi:hypothetical protein
MAETVHLYLEANGEDPGPLNGEEMADNFQFKTTETEAQQTSQSGDDEAEDSIVVDYGALKIDYTTARDDEVDETFGTETTGDKDSLQDISFTVYYESSTRYSVIDHWDYDLIG